MDQDVSIWAVVPCMGRLAHLRRSLPLFLDAGLCCVVVDYSCPEQCGAWVREEYRGLLKSGRIALASPEKPQRHFHKGRSFNIGARRAVSVGAEYLCFLDADTLVQPAFGAWYRRHVAPGKFYVFPDSHKRDLRGAVLTSAADFQQSGGYDLEFRNWGCNDTAMRLKLRLKGGLDFEFIPPALADPIRHGNDLRTRYYAQKYIFDSEIYNRKLVYAKVREWTGHELTWFVRQNDKAVLALLGDWL